MKNVVLYLLGAGASSQVLPLSCNFASRLGSFAEGLRRTGATETPAGHPIWRIGRDSLLDAIDWLAKKSAHHFSVDTFAKKLFFLGDEQGLKKLKAVISAFFVVEQSSHYVDPRYDAFFASILELDENRHVHLPEHIRIISWNYDTQLEKAFYGFCGNEQHVLEEITYNNKQIYRINGYCGSHPPGHIGDPFRAVWDTNIDRAWEAGICLYGECHSPSAPAAYINFAWEDDTHNRLKNSLAKLKLPEVTVIVIIGYSFPYFNREIDDLIFKQFYEVESIYLQFPEGKHTAVEERLRNLLPSHKKIVRITATDLFHIPDEIA